MGMGTNDCMDLRGWGDIDIYVTSRILMSLKISKQFWDL